ncbi:MAC/perforin domain-containing protein [Spirochaeta lutea]|uniref:MACPF domain-containing protein n=1 Tax=Spirochaeta lutea TaxID=1480694 RepID=A0A098QWX1_9SPIO|nr:MAC/perforin domain-containing protein [Spirochaeta lutea]KGE72076.1 hypothetical protein DC28_08220 [Spirochaeta lutea]
MKSAIPHINSLKSRVLRPGGLALLLSILVLGLGSCDLLPGPPPEDEPDPGNEPATAPDPRQNIGRGYNIFGNYADTKEVRKAVLDGNALDQDGLIEERTIETSSFQAFTGTTISEYSSQLAVNVGISGGFKAFSGSVETNFSADTYNRAEFSYATIQSQIYKTELAISTADIDTLGKYLTPQARTDINNPDTDPAELFSTYGTHIIRGLYTGGRLDYNLASDMSQITTARSLSVLASASFDAKFVSAGISAESLSEEERSLFESNTRKTLNVYGGASEFGQNIINDNDYRAWIDSVSDYPQFVGFPPSDQTGGGGLTGIWEFAQDQERSEAIHAAFLQLADEQGLDVNNSLTVEVTLTKVVLHSHDDAGSTAELYGHGGFDGYRAENNLAFYGAHLWSVSESQADDYGELGAGQWITVNRRETRTFQDFNESTAFIGLWGHLWEDDVTSDDDLGDSWAHIYMRHGWNGVTEHKLHFRNAGTEAELIFTIGIVKP